jgi:hypothetical protein
MRRERRNWWKVVIGDKIGAITETGLNQYKKLTVGLLCLKKRYTKY